MKKTLLLLMGLLFSLTVTSQIVFEKSIGGEMLDMGHDGCQTSDGGYIATGVTSNPLDGNFNIYLVKTDEYGDTLWTKSFGDAGDDRGLSVLQTDDGGYILTGHRTDTVSMNQFAFLIKTDANGDTLWTKKYAGTSIVQGNEVLSTLDGGYAVAGLANGSSAALLKTDANGGIIFSKAYNMLNFVDGQSLQQTVDSGYILTGGSYDTASAMNLYLLRTNPLGDTIWTRCFGGVDHDLGNSVSITSDSGYFIVGVTESYGAGATDVYAVKTDSNGDTLWTRTYGWSYSDWGYYGEQTTDGGYILAGSTMGSDSANLDVFLIRTNENGDTLWTKTFGDVCDDEAYAVHQTSDGGFIITGYTWDCVYGWINMYLIKTDAQGNAVGIGNDLASDNTNLFAYPNPTAGPLNLEIPLTFGKIKTLDILNAYGQLQPTPKDLYHPDISAFATGVYLFVITNEMGVTYTLSVVKE